MQRLTFVTLLAWFIPGAILTQFLLAGLSLFHDTQLRAAHAILGSILALPIGMVAFKAFVSRHAPHLRAWALVQVGIYVSQVVLIIAGLNTSSGVLQALHVFNGSLLLLVSFLVTQKFGATSMKQSSTCRSESGQQVMVSRSNESPRTPTKRKSG